MYIGCGSSLSRRDQSLYKVFQLALTALRHLHGTATEEKLKEQARLRLPLSAAGATRLLAGWRAAPPAWHCDSRGAVENDWHLNRAGLPLLNTL